MKEISLIQLGDREGKFKGSVQVAIARTGDIVLSLADEDPTAFASRGMPNPS